MVPTDLYVVRHGIAEDENPTRPGEDHWRRLTERGIERTRDSAEGMRAIGIMPEAIWTSPHVRAVETAAILEEVLSPEGGVLTESSLSFEGSNVELLERIVASGSGRLMVVGHNPMLSDLVSELSSGGRLQIRMKKASLVHLGLHALPSGPRGELIAYLPPRVLRAACR